MSNNPPVPENESTMLQKALSGLTQAIEKLVNLEVITKVGPDGPAQIVVSTRTNLVDGDIMSELPDGYFAEENRDLREFHAEKEKQAKAILDNNLDQLVNAAKTLTEAIKDSRSES